VGDVPDTLSLRRHLDGEGTPRGGIVARRVVVAALAAFAVAALLDVFGQRPSTAHATSPEASLALYAPSAGRGGDIMEARFHITAARDVHDAILRLDPGWAEGITLNTIEPSPFGQASDDGRLSLDLGHIAAGRSYLLFIQFQVNPTNVAWRRSQDVELDDGSRVLLRLHRRFTVFP
jgi:hypothetical protein